MERSVSWVIIIVWWTVGAIRMADGRRPTTGLEVFMVLLFVGALIAYVF